MAGKTRYRDEYRMVYTPGSAAPVLEPVPKEAPPLTKKQREQIARRKTSARRNQQKALLLDRRSMIIVTLAIMAFVFFGAIYIKSRSDLTTNMRHITQLESEVERLKASNDALEKQIGISVNLNEIKKKAEEYGLTYPKEGQVRYYSITNKDYMTQLPQ